MIVRKDIVEQIVGMQKDEKRKHVLTKFLKTKNGLIKKESDHNPITTELDIAWRPEINSTKNNNLT